MKPYLWILFVLPLSLRATITANAVITSPNPSTTGTFTVGANSTNGPAQIGTMVFMPSSATVPASSLNHSCVVSFDAVNLWFYLRDDVDTGSSFNYGRAGDNKTLSNSQCSYSLLTATYNVSGNTVTFTVTLSFTPAWYG